MGLKAFDETAAQVENALDICRGQRHPALEFVQQLADLLKRCALFEITGAWNLKKLQERGYGDDSLPGLHLPFQVCAFAVAEVPETLLLVEEVSADPPVWNHFSFDTANGVTMGAAGASHLQTRKMTLGAGYAFYPNHLHVRPLDGSFPPFENMVTEFAADRMPHVYASVFVVNDNEQFIVKTTPVDPPKGKKVRQRLIPRASQRPVYIMQPPRVIWRSLNRGHGDTSPVPHLRRGHWRNFRSEVFVNKRGDRTWIEAAWVGESSGVVGNRHYRVMLDK